MKIENLKKISAEQFRRITGVRRDTFEIMVKLVSEADKIKKSKGGRPNKLSIENQVLITLEYLREYRTYAHIGISYGISESSAFQTIRFVEDTLVKSKEFKLPGKKALLKNDKQYKVVLIDATETPIERPKKNKKNTTQARKNAIH